MSDPRRIMVVTGARDLARRGAKPAAAAWARAILTPFVGAMRDGDTLVAGDAEGPDEWAVEIAAAAGRRWVVYDLKGQRRTSDGAVSMWDPNPQHSRFCWVEKYPLFRNERMVAEVAVRASEGRRVDALALHAPWAPTHGTAHTVKLLARHGIIAREYVCPPEHGPQGWV